MSCYICKRSYTVNKKGFIRPHGPISNRCRGGGLQPAAQEDTTTPTLEDTPTPEDTTTPTTHAPPSDISSMEEREKAVASVISSVEEREKAVEEREKKVLEKEKAVEEMEEKVLEKEMAVVNDNELLTTNIRLVKDIKKRLYLGALSDLGKLKKLLAPKLVKGLVCLICHYECLNPRAYLRHVRGMHGRFIMPGVIKDIGGVKTIVFDEHYLKRKKYEDMSNRAKSTFALYSDDVVALACPVRGCPHRSVREVTYEKHFKKCHGEYQVPNVYILDENGRESISTLPLDETDEDSSQS